MIVADLGFIMLFFFERAVWMVSGCPTLSHVFACPTFVGQV